MDTVTVWIDDWQIQCCGDPFKVGDTVRWTAVPWKSPLSDDVYEGTIDYYYENHAGKDDRVFEITGTVTAITALYAMMAADSVKPKWKVPVSWQSTAVDEADGDNDDVDDLTFQAYVVHLDKAMVQVLEKNG